MRAPRCQQRHHGECRVQECDCSCHDEARDHWAQARSESSRDFSVREDGEGYVTPVVERRNCHWCGVTIPQHAEGRRRRFCSAGCRVRMNRATPKLFTIEGTVTHAAR